jgi:branched-chain amino acid transport system permease protein
MLVSRLRSVAWFTALVVFGLLPLVIGESNLYLLVDFFVAALFAMGFNLMLGQAGLLSFGHSAFYGLGAYTVALLQAKLGVPVLVGVAAAPLVAGLFALAIGFFTVRLSGMYFAMLTLAFSQLIFALVANWYSFTGGDNGMPVELPPFLFQVEVLYYIALGLTAACIGLIALLIRSPFGTALAAIRENPQRAAFIGLNVKAYQLAVFVISGALTGVAGAIRALVQQMAFPSLLFWVQSADPVLMTLAGGVNSFAGPVVGAAIFVFLNFVVASYTSYPLMVFGVVVLLLVMFLPEGVVGTAAKLIRRRSSRKAQCEIRVQTDRQAELTP